MTSALWLPLLARADWWQGMYEGEVTYSGSGSAFYDTGDTADPDKRDVDYHTYDDPDYYSRIDPEETAIEMAANNLDVYATFLEFASADSLGWDNLYDFSDVL